VSSTEAIQRPATPTLQVELPTASMVASTPGLSVGEECRKAELDTGVGADTRSLDPKAAKILLEAVAATWKVHQLQDIIPTASRVPDYSEKPVT
jgi:hypothetical protein